MTEHAIFTLSDEHEIFAAFVLGDGEDLDVLAMAYRKPDGEIEAKLRQRYLSGRKDVRQLNIATDDSEGEVVDKLESTYEKMRSDFPNARGRFVGPHDARQLFTADLLTFAMQGSQTSLNDRGESQAEWTRNGF